MNYNSDAITGMLTALGIFAILLVIILISILVIFIVAKCKMYKKAGKSGWEAIVPFYNDWVYTQIAGVEWWWFIALIASSLFSVSTSNGEQTISFNFGTVVGLFGTFVCNYNISKKLHKDVGFAVLMTIFPFIMIPLIGFSSNYSWDNSVKVTKNGPFDDKKDDGTFVSDKEDETVSSKDSVEKDTKYCPNCGNKIAKDSKFCGKCGKEI